MNAPNEKPKRRRAPKDTEQELNVAQLTPKATRTVDAAAYDAMVAGRERWLKKELALAKASG